MYRYMYPRQHYIAPLAAVVRLVRLYTHTHMYNYLYEQALVCLCNRDIVDASRGRTFHCNMANDRFF